LRIGLLSVYRFCAIGTLIPSLNVAVGVDQEVDC
jgi:hypothetical protein